MKTLLKNCISLPLKCISLLFFCISLLFGDISLEAATPSFSDFYGTNGIIIRTNGNKVQVDGQFLTNGASAVYFTTNLIAQNIYTTNLFATNITVENINITSNLFVNNAYATNIFVEQNIFTTNLYATNIFVDQTLVTSNFTTIFNISSNIITTNINVNQTLVVSNTYVTNLFANTIIGKDILWTNDNGTVRLIDETRVGIGTNAGDALWLLERNANAINYLNATSNGFVNFQIASNGNLSTIRGISYVWPGTAAGAASIITNDGSGNLGNWPVSALPSFPSGLATFRTNQFTTNVPGSAVVGSLVLSGTTSQALTNGARTVLEYHPTNISVRIGQVIGNGQAGLVTASSSTFSNYWDPTNVGFGSIVLGSNSLNRAEWSTIAGGGKNVIETNSVYSFIGGGGQNYIHINSANSVISGGSNNVINSQGIDNVIAGGGDNLIRTSGTKNSTIGGGIGNIIGSLAACNYSTIGGGQNNFVFGLSSTIAGGQQNGINASTTVPNYATIGGGFNNVMQAGFGVNPTGSTIGGGENNLIGLSANGGARDSTIAGGIGNFVDSDSGNDLMAGTIVGGAGNTILLNSYNSFIGGGKSNRIGSSLGTSFILAGHSNNVTAAQAGVIGWWTTNSTANTIAIGMFDTNKVTVDSLGLKVEGQSRTKAGKSSTFANMGGSISAQTTEVYNAGTGETNLMTYSIPANAMTNATDRLLVRASGKFAPNADAKQIKLVYGSETIWDSTSQAQNAGFWTVTAEIIRTGNTAQICNVDYAGSGTTLYTLANVVVTAQTNGIATTLKFTATCAGNGDVTNSTMTVEWRGAP